MERLPSECTRCGKFFINPLVREFAISLSALVPGFFWIWTSDARRISLPQLLPSFFLMVLFYVFLKPLFLRPRKMEYD
jgi:hypothetical protein